MRKTMMLMLAALLTLCACKKESQDTEQIRAAVEALNAGGERTLANGTTLQRCEYVEKDSLFTYYIKVADNRFEGVDADSLKVALMADMKQEKSAKLTNLLKRNSITLKYVYDIQGDTMAVAIAPTEW